MTVTTITEIKITNNRFCLCGSHDRLCGQNLIKRKKVQVDFFHTADTSEIEKINVLLHEKHHLINDDCNNSLSQIDTFKEHIENNSEKGRILDFMSLVNSEYPIDDSFNYQDYLKNADIPSKYENYVKEIATQFYNENKKNNNI